MDAKKAPFKIIKAIRQRVQRKEGAQLLEKTVRLVAIPKTPYEATLFIYQQPNGGKLVLVCELDRPDLPHIYNAKELSGLSPREIFGATAENLSKLCQTVTHDPRFSGGRRIIEINGRAL